MGTNISKTVNEPAARAQKSDLEVDGNPDPRSPTPEITRTPLQNKNGSKHNITKNVDLRKAFESGQTNEKLILNNPILSAVLKNHLQCYDPRSPTQDFERTPIVIPTIDENNKEDNERNLKQQNDTFTSPSLINDLEDSFDTLADEIKLSPDLVIAKNLYDEFYDSSVNESLNENKEPLGSSTTTNNSIEQVLSSEITTQRKVFLETNFDYVEVENEHYEDSEEKIQKNENTEEIDLEYEKAPLFKVLNDDPRSPSDGIERTPIVIVKTNETDNEHNVEEVPNETLTKFLQTKLTEQSKLIDNLDGLLIYEDESNVINTPRKAKSINSNGARTPLSCMKNKADVAHTRSKSANTIDQPNKDSNIQVKHSKHVSHIPRLKSLSKHIPTGSSVSLKNISKSSAISGDCENTPPHSHRDRWDKDSSVVL